MEKRICRHCGKEGTLESFPFRGSTMTVLKHYCPVKAAKKKAIKDAQIQKSIDKILSKPVEECWQGWFLPAESILLTRYPHRHVDIIDEVFHGVTLTEEEKLAKQEYEEARLRFQRTVYNYIKAKRKIPTLRRYQMIAEKI